MRFPIDVSVVWWQDEVNKGQQGEGRIYDVSELGVFVLTSFSPPVGARVKLQISIAAVPDGPRSLRMEVEGRVLRVEEVQSGGQRDGFAMLSDRAILDDADQSEESSASGNMPKE